jgi:mersacidin/lichenicidin family type 2 lantibiotic
MSKEQIIRAWKDPGYRAQLNEAQVAALPPNPAGVLSANQPQMGETPGIISTVFCTKLPVCTYWLICQ